MNAKHFEIKGFCDSLYNEVTDFKSKMNNFSNAIEHLEGREKKELYPYMKQLAEISDFLEWKLEIFAKVCLTDMSQHVGDVENRVSVPIMEVPIENRLTSPGYIGG
jgi:hypothetical protein